MIILWEKIKGYVAILLAAILAVLGAEMYGRRKGSTETAQNDADKATAAQATQVAAAATQKSDNAEVRHDVEIEIKAQPVTDDVPNPSSDELSKSWSRD
jgi:hypothetical protein